MRICLVSPTYPRESNPGSGSVPYYLSKYVKRETLFITRRRAGKPLKPEPNVGLKEVWYPEFRMPAEPNTLLKIVLVLCKSFSYLIFLGGSLPYIIQFRPEIVHIHTPIPLLHGIFCKAVLKAKVALTLHGTDFIRLKSEKILQWSIRKWVDTIFVVSKAMLEDLEQILPEKHLVYAPNGVDTSHFYDQKRARKKQLVAVGTLKWQKGYEYLLKAVKRVFSNHHEYRLAIIGDGPLERQLTLLAESLGIEENVDFLGRLSRRNVTGVLNESSIFVMSSVSEGFPRALIEAIACGAPVVATDVGSCREIVSSAVGFVVKPRDPDEFAEAVNRLIENEELRVEFSRNCQEVAKRYDWKRTSEIVENEYRRLISGQMRNYEIQNY